jgi:hypothetical protein
MSTMTATLAFKQQSDLDPALIDPATRDLSSDALVGRWVNTNPVTRGVAEIAIERDGERFILNIKATGQDEPIQWPPTPAQALANLEEEAGQRVIALSAIFDFGFMKSETYLRVNKGVLVIVLFNSFTDESRRSNYVTREFFYRRD